MENLLEGPHADASVKEISPTKLQCVSCFTKSLSNGNASLIATTVKTFHCPGRVQMGTIGLPNGRLCSCITVLPMKGCTPEQSSSCSGLTHATSSARAKPAGAEATEPAASTSTPVAIPPQVRCVSTSTTYVAILPQVRCASTSTTSVDIPSHERFILASM